MPSIEMPSASPSRKPAGKRIGLSEDNLKNFIKAGSPKVNQRPEGWAKPGDRLPYKKPVQGKSLAEQIFEEEEARKRGRGEA